MQWSRPWTTAIWAAFALPWLACCSTRPLAETPTVDLGEVWIEQGPTPGTYLVSAAALARLTDAVLKERAALERCRAGLR
jgi:hypothetical protein